MRRLFAILLALAALGVPAAAQAEVPELLTELSPEGKATGSGAGEFENPQGIATDPTNGHIYVADYLNQRIDEFTPWGIFVRAWGWGVDTGAAELQTCTTLSGCQAGIAGGGNGQFSGPNGVAVDSTGDVYVVDRANHRIERFSSEGDFLEAWGGDVVASGPDDSSQDEEQEVVVAATSGTFKLSFKDPLGGASTATTPALPFNATAAEVEAALDGLATIASHGGSVSVTGGPGDGAGSSPFIVTFEGGLAGDDVLSQLKLDSSALGASEAGARLLCDTGVVADTIEYAWLRNGEPIAGATAPAYVTGPEDEGKAIQCQVTAKDAKDGDVFTANPAYVAPPEPATAPPVAPDILEISQQGELRTGGSGGAILTCGPGGWQNASSFTYRWYRNGAQIAAATAQSYEVTTADLATPATFQCEAIGHNAGGAVAEASVLLDSYPYPNPREPRPAEGAAGAAMDGARVVVQGGGPEVCKAASGDVCKVGDTGRGDGQFEPWSFEATPIAAGPGDTIYVGDFERIQEFEADGSFKSDLPLPEGIVHSLAVAPSGNIFVDFEHSGELRPEAEREAFLHELNPSGAEIASFDLGDEHFKAFAEALAADSAGNAYAASDVEPSGSSLSFNQVLELDPEGNPLIPLGSYFPIDPGNGTVDAEFHGIATNGVGDVMFDWHEPNPGHNPVGDYLNVYGPSPIAYEPPPAAAPEIGEEFAAKAGSESAEVRAKINPKFWPDAAYRVQYGAAPCEEGGCEETQAAALTSKSVNSNLLTAPVKLTGLQEGTVYHYRFVAESGGGGPTVGPEETFRTYRQAPASLPDSRAYELVSPANKDGGEVGTPGPASGAAEFSVQPLQAAPTGEAITYSSFTSFGAEPESAPAASQYISRAGAGGLWAPDNVNPRFEEGFTRDPFVGFSADLSRAAVIAISPPLTEDAAQGFQDLYLRDNQTGALTAITTEAHRPQLGFANPRDYCLFLGGASADFGRVFFAAKGALNPGDPAANGFNLYEWSAGGGIELVSVLPNGTAATPSTSTNFGPTTLGVSSCDPEGQLMRHAVSAAGAKAFWTYDGSYESAKEPLFAYLQGAPAVRLDKPNEGVSGAGGEGFYWDASGDGSKVFFTDTHKLTSTPTKAGFPDLYRYDFAKAAGQRLVDLTPHTPEAADVHGLIGASEDGSYAYFAAKGVLDATPNGEGETAEPGANNLYAWRQGAGVRFVARTATAPGWQEAEVSPDGRHLAFLSGGQAYLYGYEADSLACASCNAAHTKPLGAASFPGWTTPYQQPRFLAADGSRLFFETFDRLSPNDESEKQDVYEFEAPGAGGCTEANPSYNADAGGCQFLLSGGRSDDESYFLDASESGEGAFFSTREGLVYGDSDGRYDIYDARVGGSSPQPPPPLCEGEACREGGTAPPTTQPPASLGFQGPGNPPSPHCRKGTHLVTRKGAARCVRNHRKHHHRRHRTTKRRP